MKYSKLVALGLIGALSLGVVGCSNNGNQNNQNPDTKQSDTTATQQNAETMNRDMYKQRFGELYQTNIARLENYNMYSNIPVEQDTKDYEGNQKYLDDLKAAYSDSEKNIQQFVDSLKSVKTDDQDIKDMNDKLVSEGEKLLADIKEKRQKLDNVPQDLIDKSEKDFKQGINDLIAGDGKNVNDQTDMGFNKMLKDIRNTLGLN